MVGRCNCVGRPRRRGRARLGRTWATMRSNVSLDGKPVADGVISFQPEKETPGPSAEPVIEGEYDLHGVLPGVYRVEVRAG